MKKVWACDHKKPFNRLGGNWKCPDCPLTITTEKLNNKTIMDCIKEIDELNLNAVSTCTLHLAAIFNLYDLDYEDLKIKLLEKKE